jgi:hypothetical protein
MPLIGGGGDHTVTPGRSAIYFFRMLRIFFMYAFAAALPFTNRLAALPTFDRPAAFLARGAADFFLRLLPTFRPDARAVPSAFFRIVFCMAGVICPMPPRLTKFAIVNLYL